MSDLNGNGSLPTRIFEKILSKDGTTALIAFAVVAFLMLVIFNGNQVNAKDLASIKTALQITSEGKSDVLQTVITQHASFLGNFADFKSAMLEESKKQTKLQALMCTFQAKTQKQIQDCISISQL